MKKYIFIIPLVFVFYTCTKTDPNAIYEGCCEQSSMDIKIGKGKLIIPNYMSPDKDFWVDYFDVFTDSLMKEVKDVKFYNNSGRELKFIGEIRSAGTIGKIYRWTISETNDNSNPSLGNIKYTLTAVSIDGISRSVSSSFCSIKCKDAKSIIKKISGCNSTIQYDVDKFDNSLPLDDCF
jgi:hypothetical protein